MSSLSERATAAFNRHGSFTARPVNHNLAVELRHVDTGAQLATVWLPVAAEDEWAWECGNAKTVELAKAIARATDLAVRRRADASTAERLAALYELVEAGANGIPDCATDEADLEQVSRG